VMLQPEGRGKLKWSSSVRRRTALEFDFGRRSAESRKSKARQLVERCIPRSISIFSIANSINVDPSERAIAWGLAVDGRAVRLGATS